MISETVDQLKRLLEQKKMIYFNFVQIIPIFNNNKLIYNKLTQINVLDISTQNSIGNKQQNDELDHHKHHFLFCLKGQIILKFNHLLILERNE